MEWDGMGGGLTDGVGQGKEERLRFWKDHGWDGMDGIEGRGGEGCGRQGVEEVRGDSGLRICDSGWDGMGVRLMSR